MSLSLTQRIREITQRVTRRETSLFAADVEQHLGDARERVSGRRVLVVGGAGSIGASTVLALLPHGPAELTVIDPSENNLAELVRTIRGSAQGFRGELRLVPVGYGSALASQLLGEIPPHDLVLSFAAMKHVRSERDVYSVLRMLEVNLVEADRFLSAIRRAGHGRSGVFFVSTDKAANPVSLMGASKRVMELLLWAHAGDSPASLIDGGEAPALPRVTTARFANVAFSDGSLPWAFLQRLEKRQALAAPSDVRRYLLSPWEAGDLCLLASVAAPSRHVIIPRMDPDEHTVSFPDVAEATLASMGLVPAWYDDEVEARGMVETELQRGRYPVVITKADTSGEKAIEEFVGHGEGAIDVGFAALDAIAAPDRVVIEPLSQLLRNIDDACCGRAALPEKGVIVRWLQRLVSELKHVETGASLDARL